MITLAVDTSTPQGSVALARDGALAAEINLELAGHHSTHVLPAVTWILESAGVGMDEIDLFACAKGPGSFTGLRIGIATCLGLAAGRDKPVVGVAATRIVAHPFAVFPHRVAALLDARKGQVFFQLFRAEEDGDIREEGPPLSIGWEKVGGRLSAPTLLVGRGADLYRDELKGALGERALFPPPGLCYHHALSLARIAESVFREKGAKEPVVPLYVRASDAELNYHKKKAVLPEGGRA